MVFVHDRIRYDAGILWYSDSIRYDWLHGLIQARGLSDEDVIEGLITSNHIDDPPPAQLFWTNQFSSGEEKLKQNLKPEGEIG